MKAEDYRPIAGSTFQPPPDPRAEQERQNMIDASTRARKEQFMAEFILARVPALTLMKTEMNASERVQQVEHVVSEALLAWNLLQRAVRP